MSIGRTNHRGIGKRQIANMVTNADCSSKVALWQGSSSHQNAKCPSSPLCRRRSPHRRRLPKITLRWRILEMEKPGCVPGQLSADTSVVGRVPACRSPQRRTPGAPGNWSRASPRRSSRCRCSVRTVPNAPLSAEPHFSRHLRRLNGLVL